MNTAEIISKITMTLSLINSNNDFDFFWLSYQNSLFVLFLPCKISLCQRNTHDISGLLAFVKTVAASRHKRPRNKSLSRFVDN